LLGGKKEKEKGADGLSEIIRERGKEEKGGEEWLNS